MKYCRNCGKETKSKICPHCGANSKKANKFCSWCGAEVDPNAVICLNCHEKTKDGIITKFTNLISVVVAVIIIVIALAILSENAILTGILFILSAVLLLPFVKKLIKKVTFGKKAIRTILSIVRIVLVVGLLVVGCMNIPETEPVPNKVYSNVATDKALEIFHSEVTLKNEASFVLNDSTVTYVDSYEGNDNLALVTVVLDYSAQNGFGGMNRDTYTVKMIFRYSDGTYRKAN